MQPISEGWIKNATELNDFDLKWIIDTAIKTEADFKPWTHILKALTVVVDQGHAATIVDFGAGMLRHAWAIHQMSQHWKVIAYDSEPMLRRGWKHIGFAPDKFQDSTTERGNEFYCASEWSQVKQHEDIDAILCIIVLQHMTESAILEALKDFAEISPWLCVSGRQHIDEDINKRVPQIIRDSGLWDLRCSDADLFEDKPQAHQFSIWRRKQ